MNGMTGASKVFLSYATEDEEHAACFRRLAWEKRAELTFEDCAVRDGFSADWRAMVQEKIAVSDVVACLVGEETHLSEPVGWEIEAAITLGKPVLAFILVPWPVVVPEVLRDNGVGVHRLATGRVRATQVCQGAGLDRYLVRSSSDI